MQRNQKKNKQAQRRPKGGGGEPKHPSLHPFATHQVNNGKRVGFPGDRVVNMSYCSTQDVSSASGLVGKYQFRMNSAFDPDFTATGHQPMAFDQWAQFYNHYVVEECTWEATVAVPEVTAWNAMVGVYVSDDGTIPTDVNTLLELGSSIQFLTGNTKAPIFKGKVDMAQFFNRGDRSTLGLDSELRALVTANPAEVAFLSVWVRIASGLVSITGTWVVNLNFRVRFMEPKDLGPSLSGQRRFPTLKKSWADEACGTAASLPAAVSDAPSVHPPPKGDGQSSGKTGAEPGEYVYVRVPAATAAGDAGVVFPTG